MLEENFYKEYTISALSYCKFVIYYVGYIITVLTYRGHGVARPRIIICHTVNFVLTPIEKTCNEQYHNFSLQEENVKPNLNSMTNCKFLFIIYICTPIQQILQFYKKCFTEFNSLSCIHVQYFY